MLYLIVAGACLAFIAGLVLLALATWGLALAAGKLSYWRHAWVVGVFAHFVTMYWLGLWFYFSFRALDDPRPDSQIQWPYFAAAIVTSFVVTALLAFAAWQIILMAREYWDQKDAKKIADGNPVDTTN